MTGELREYQRDAIKAMHRAGGRAIFAYAPGTGKTATTIRYLRAEGAKRILAVTPNGPVLRHWTNEQQDWWEESLPWQLGTGTPSYRAGVRDLVARQGFAEVVNYEIMRGDIDELIKLQWDAVVFDESHRLKNRNSQTFKAAIKLARRVDKVILVTGTPILNRADELWTSLAMLEPGVRKSFWRWAEFHFHIVSVRYRPGRPIRQVCKNEKCRTCKGRGLLPGHAKLLRAELGDRLIQKPLSELLPDMPPVTETYLRVQLSPEERRQYDSMVKDAWMEFDGNLIVAVNDVSKQTRLRQLASDWSVFGKPAIGTKVRAVCDLVSDLESEQVVIFAAFRETVAALCREIPQSVGYHGGLDRAERDSALQDFKTGKARVLVGTISTMGEGIDGMQVARNVIFLDRDWTPARNEQAVARLQRSGQLSSVNVTHVVAENTVDDTVASALQRKRDVIQAVLGTRETRNTNAVHRS